MMRILIVDDHTLFREGLASLIEARTNFSIVGLAGSVDEAITMTRDLQPDLVLMDFGLPDGSGLEATQAILAGRPETKIVFLTVHGEDERLFAAIRYGARGYLLKNVPVPKLLAYLQGLEQGEAAIPQPMLNRILDEFSRTGTSPEPAAAELSKLTSRELEVLQELATEATNQEIADRLVISENTVKKHVGNILAKLNVSNRRMAIKFAHHHRLIKIPAEHSAVD